VRFEVRPAEIPEHARPGESASELVTRLAREKALFVARLSEPDRLVLGADTVVVVDDEVLGKPTSSEHAVELLGKLVGRWHSVLTGVCVLRSPGSPARECVVESRVCMRAAGDAELRAYVASGEPMDKAGAYALQGEGRRFVTQVVGSESNVIGLPLEETLELLRELGAELPPAALAALAAS
jgi:septum formation protein